MASTPAKRTAASKSGGSAYMWRGSSRMNTSHRMRVATHQHPASGSSTRAEREDVWENGTRWRKRKSGKERERESGERAGPMTAESSQTARSRPYKTRKKDGGDKTDDAGRAEPRVQAPDGQAGAPAQREDQREEHGEEERQRLDEVSERPEERRTHVKVLRDAALHRGAVGVVEKVEPADFRQVPG
eukprot:3268748-Rhodomonas_salina.1